MGRDFRELVLTEWEELQAWLPENTDALAFSTGAIQKRRLIKSGSELLRVVFAYSMLDFSLRSTAAWMAGVGTKRISDVAVLKRLKAAPAFLNALLQEMLGWRLKPEKTFVQCKVPFNVRLIDATVVTEPGSKGTDWRLHVSYNPGLGRIDNVELTDKHGGENLSRAHAQAGDLLVGDRAYPQCERILEVLEAKAHVLTRMGHSAIKLFDEAGKPLDVLASAKHYCPKKGKVMIAHQHAWIHGKQGKKAPVRIIMLRKSKEAADQERRRINVEAKKKGRQPTERTLDAADFTLLLTTVTEESVVPSVVMADIYRVRWQIELAFKQLKSLLNLDQLRAKDPSLAKTYLLGKMVAAVLLETIAADCRDISPWGLPLRSKSMFMAGGEAFAGDCEAGYLWKDPHTGSV